MTAPKKFTLGRGLDALISTDAVRTQGSSSINEIEIEKIQPNPGQPRREFTEETLAELAASIKEIGIIQPITLRKMTDDTYQIIAGERRFRASQLAGLKTIPAYIRTASDEHMMEMALIENIQREDLNAVEIALAYQSLIEEYNLSQEELSDRVGKNRATVANFLRLLKLPAQIQVALKNREVDMGHARALLALDNPKAQIALFEEIKKHGYSVRKVEELVKAINAGAPIKQKKEKGASHDYTALKKQLSTFFHSKVQLSCNDSGKGKISIPFGSQEELQRLIEMFDKLKS